MRQERLNIGLFFRIGISLLPIIFGMPTVAMVFCAYNIAISFILCGPLTSVVSALSSVCISMFFFGIYGEGAKVQGLFVSLEAVLCAAACVYALIFRRNFFLGVWLAAAGFLVPSFASLRCEAAKMGLSVARYLTDMPVAIMKEQFNMFISQNKIQIDAGLFEKLIDTVHNLTIAIIPSMLVITSIIIGYVIMWLVSLHERRFRGGISKSFSHIRMTKSMLVFIAAAILVCVFNIHKSATYVAMNIFLIMAGIGFFAGLSIVDFYLRRIVKSSVLRVILHLAIIMSSSMFAAFSQYLNIFIVYALVGAVDVFADFRKLRIKDEKKEELDETAQ